MLRCTALQYTDDTLKMSQHQPSGQQAPRCPLVVKSGNPNENTSVDAQ